MTPAPRLLALAAAPTFASMALISAVPSPERAICTGAPGSPVDAMTVMYLLMALFHLQPWLHRRERVASDPGDR